MQQSLSRSILCIFKPDGRIVGTGFLAAENLVVTCAHVVREAGGGPGERVQLAFQTGGEHIQATVRADTWSTPEAQDIAILTLESQLPKGVAPLHLGASGSTAGHPFTTCGYPGTTGSDSLLGGGEILGVIELKGSQVLQLRSQEVTPGFSGAPVLDTHTGRVVGMVTAILNPDRHGRLAETAFITPSETLRLVCPELQLSDTCPYIGLDAFTSETAQFFFGRDALVKKLLDTLRSECRFMAVFGPSGSGKSSLVHAGLLPALRDGKLPGSQKWMQFTMRPGNSPFDALKAAGLELLNIPTDAERVVLYIDQFEELFIHCSDQVCKEFVGELATALENPRFLLVISMRDDFYSTFNDKAAVLAGSSQKMVIDVPKTLASEELAAMIERPAKVVGLALEEGLIELILKDLNRDGELRSSTLPLLEFALTQLWEKCHEEGLLTHEAYHLIGGVTGSLARWADNAYSELPKASQVLAESLLISLVHPGDEKQGLPDTRKRCQLADYDEPIQGVIRHFADKRLLVTSDQTVELVHDALIREWRKLQVWVKENHANLQFIQDVENAARQWEASGRKHDRLIHRGRLLRSIEIISKGPRYIYSEIGKDYLHACKRKRLDDRLMGGVVLSLIIMLVFNWLWFYVARKEAVPGKWVTISAGSFVMGMDETEAVFAYSQCTAWAKENDKENDSDYRCTTPTPEPDDPSGPALTNWSGRQLRAELPRFAILENEVTNAQYQQCIDKGTCQASDWIYEEEDVNKPAVYLNWFQAEAYCEWLGGRLPTEGEWEKAARGPDGNYYPWGDFWDQDSPFANLETGSGSVEVTRFAGSDVSYYGVVNLAGNVREFTASSGDVYLVIGQTFSNTIFAPKGDGLDVPVIVRGGSWALERSEGIASKRETVGVLYGYDNVGFRCVCPEGNTCNTPWNGWWVWFGDY